MEVTVDAAGCTGQGRCYSLAPEVFEADDDGFCAQKGTTFTVSAELAGQARLGAQSCPEEAITVRAVSGQVPVP